MQTVKEFATLAAKDATRYGLPEREFYLLFCEDDVTRKRITRVGEDKVFFDMVVTASASTREDLMINHHFNIERPGWPDEWSQDGGLSLAESRLDDSLRAPSRGAFGQTL